MSKADKFSPVSTKHTLAELFSVDFRRTQNWWHIWLMASAWILPNAFLLGFVHSAINNSSSTINSQISIVHSAGADITVFSFGVYFILLFYVCVGVCCIPCHNCRNNNDNKVHRTKHRLPPQECLPLSATLF